MGDKMDKINLKDKKTLEKLQEYLNSEDLTEEEIISILEGLTEEEKDEIMDIISDEVDDDDEDDDFVERKTNVSKTSIMPISRRDMVELSDLTNEQIVEQFQIGNQNALAALVEKNQGLVRSRASYFFRSHGNDLDLEDLVQSGMLGMIRAAEKFDLSLGYKFTTYAYKWIDKAIRKAINKEGHTIRIPAGKYLK